MFRCSGRCGASYSCSASAMEGAANDQTLTISEENENPTAAEEEKQKINWAAWRAEFSLDALWRKRTWGEIFGHFAKALILGLIPSLFDVVTDALNGKNFIVGTDYMKRVTNMSDPQFDNCAHVGSYVKYNKDGEMTTEYSEVLCHEKDPIWGYVTLLLIFFPGVNVVYSKNLNLKSWCGCFTGLFIGLCFPVVLLGVKTIALVNPGPEMEKLTGTFTIMEGTFESTYQFILTLFIVFSRGDRSPSSIQIASLVASLLTIVKIQIEGFLLEVYDEKFPSLEKVKRAAVLTPMFLTSTIFKLGSIAMTAAILRWIGLVTWLILFSLAMVICAVTYRCIYGKWRMMGMGFPVHAVKLKNVVDHPRKTTRANNVPNRLSQNIAWFVIHPLVLTTLLVLATIEHNNESVEIFSQDKRNILVHDLNIFWVLYTAIMISGIVSAVLIYFQIWRPHTERVVS